MALTDSLVAYWELDEASGNRSDSHGSNTLTDNNTVGSATGKINSGADFEDANSESLSITDNTTLSMGDIDMTISMWLNFESFPSFTSPLAKDNNTTREYGFYTVSNSIKFYVFGSSGGGNYAEIGSGVVLSTGTWYHVIGYHDSVANTIGIIINDGTDTNTSHSTGIYDGNAPFTIGVGGNNLYYDGIIDEVGIWKRKLSASEITELYNSGSGLAYPFGAAAGVVITPFRNRVMSPGHIFGGKCLC